MSFKNIYANWSLRDKYHGKQIYLMLKLDEQVVSVSRYTGPDDEYLLIEMIPDRAKQVCLGLEEAIQENDF